MNLSPETSLNERPVSYICRILRIPATPEPSPILKCTATRSEEPEKSLIGKRKLSYAKTVFLNKKRLRAYPSVLSG